MGERRRGLAVAFVVTRRKAAPCHSRRRNSLFYRLFARARIPGGRFFEPTGVLFAGRVTIGWRRRAPTRGGPRHGASAPLICPPPCPLRQASDVVQPSVTLAMNQRRREARARVDVYAFGVSDSDFEPPPFVFEAGEEGDGHEAGRLVKYHRRSRASWTLKRGSDRAHRRGPRLDAEAVVGHRRGRREARVFQPRDGARTSRRYVVIVPARDTGRATRSRKSRARRLCTPRLRKRPASR